MSQGQVMRSYMRSALPGNGQISAWFGRPKRVTTNRRIPIGILAEARNSGRGALSMYCCTAPELDPQSQTEEPNYKMYMSTSVVGIGAFKLTRIR